MNGVISTGSRPGLARVRATGRGGVDFGVGDEILAWKRKILDVVLSEPQKET